AGQWNLELLRDKAWKTPSSFRTIRSVRRRTGLVRAKSKVRIYMGGLRERLSMQRERRLTWLCQSTVSNVFLRMTGVILVALAVSHASHAAAHDNNVVLFQADSRPLLAVDQKNQSTGVDHCGAEVASAEPPAEADAASHMLRSR